MKMIDLPLCQQNYDMLKTNFILNYRFGTESPIGRDDIFSRGKS